MGVTLSRPIMTILDIFAMIVTIVAFVGVYVYLFAKYGYKVAYFSPLTWFLLPLIFAPFAFSPENARSIDPNVLQAVWDKLPLAIELFCLSGLFFLAGLLFGHAFLRKLFSDIFDAVAIRLLRTAGSWYVICALVVTQFIIFAFLVSQGLVFGKGIDLGFENTTIRPLLSIWSVLNVFFIVTCSANFICNRNFLNGIIVAMSLILSFATGSRSASLLTLFIVFLIFVSARNLRIVIFPIIMISMSVPISIIQYNARGAEITTEGAPTSDDVFNELLYGNQFSDVRDFAWILSHFDGNYLYGKTYIAGYSPFIPSALSDFRQKWGWGRWSTETVDLDPLLHGGLRSGLFSEAYFNFGPLFMLTLAFVVGAVFGALTAWEGDRAANLESFRERVFVGFASFLISSIVVSCVFTSAFYESLIYALILLVA
jgi:hypothetical protein